VPLLRGAEDGTRAGEDTMARVRAMKKIPTMVVPPDLLFTVLATTGQRNFKISKMKSQHYEYDKKSRLSITLVEILFRISGRYGLTGERAD
jgi:hypothetical protein